MLRGIDFGGQGRVSVISVANIEVAIGCLFGEWKLS